MTNLQEQGAEIERLHRALEEETRRADAFELKYLRLAVDARTIAERLKRPRDSQSSRTQDAAELLAAIGE